MTASSPFEDPNAFIEFALLFESISIRRVLSQGANGCLHGTDKDFYRGVVARRLWHALSHNEDACFIAFWGQNVYVRLTYSPLSES